MRHLVSASHLLGELNGLCAALPDPEVLINTIILQEYKDSSAIENIVTTQDDLYRASRNVESGSHAAREILKYREALYAGFNRMNPTGSAAHRKHDGDYANDQAEPIRHPKHAGYGIENGLTGERVYTPPCGENLIREKLSALERFINDP